MTGGWEQRRHVSLGASYAELYTLAVLPQSRAPGVGTALLDAVDAALADRAVPNLRVAVMAQNEAATRLQRRRGLIPGELILYRIGPQPDPAGPGQSEGARRPG